MSAPKNPRLFEKFGSGSGSGSEITLRDLFAAAALAGWLADTEATGTQESVARSCYSYADAMLAERASSESK